MKRLFLTLILSCFSFAALAAEGSWSYEFNDVADYKKHLRYSAGVEVGYSWYSVYPQKDKDILLVRFGYWDKEEAVPSQFEITLEAEDGKTLSFRGDLNSENLYLGMFGDSPVITISISDKHLDFHSTAASLRVVVSGKVFYFPMENSRAAINQAQNAAR